MPGASGDCRPWHIFVGHVFSFSTRSVAPICAVDEDGVCSSVKQGTWEWQRGLWEEHLRGSSSEQTTVPRALLGNAPLSFHEAPVCPVNDW